MTELPTDVFGRRMRQERERTGMSPAELARRVSELADSIVDQNDLARIENGQRSIRLDEAVAAADVLGLPLAALLSDDPERDSEYLISRFVDELAATGRQVEQLRARMHQLGSAIAALTSDRQSFARTTTPPNRRYDLPIPGEYYSDAIDAQMLGGDDPPVG